MQVKTLDRTEVGVTTIAPFAGLCALVSVYTRDGQPICVDMPFHWNGTELVICSIGAASWRNHEAAPIDVSLAAEGIRFQFSGNGSSDEVGGIAPEYRAQLVTHFGPEKGNQAADESGPTARTSRLFVTPHWDSQDPGDADR